MKIPTIIFAFGLLVSPVWAESDGLMKQEFQNFASYKGTGYHQKYRPQFHFSSLRNWINDPNGMVYLDGEYHLFFQHNPKGKQWGNMTWGHAVSKDMIHWQQLNHAILPYRNGTIYSGTAVIDKDNVLKKQQGEQKTMAAFFTFAFKDHKKHPYHQAMAYSTDRGRTFTLYNEGQVIVPNQGFDNGERDPKVFWHEESKKWVMILWVKKGKPGKVRFFTSDNLVDWTHVSDFDRNWVYECMDFVHLPVDGDKNNKKWVLFDASFDYEIGAFDGKTFTTDRKTRVGDHGKNYYAAQTFNNMPDDRTVAIGWMRYANFAKFGTPFNSCMSFPNTLELRATPDGVKLFRWPIKEIEKLYVKTSTFENLSVAKLNEAVKALSPALIDVSIEFDANAKFEMALQGYKISFDGTSIHGAKRSLKPRIIDGKVKLRVLLDRGTIELYVSEGETVATTWLKPLPQDQQPKQAVAFSGEGNVSSFVLNELKSAWSAKQ